MRVIGTAGHVDHGKSTLVEALTGIHPDRLKEEREREMTIDLGFAWTKLPDGEEIGIVDVPGHRDFIENMLSGIGGIDAVLFVVASDEGVMPQTREHLAILDLLQIQRGVIALTKIDLVDDEWLGLIRDDILKILSGTCLENAPMVPVSARQNSGLETLKLALSACLADSPPRPNLGRPRLPIDRVFSIAGFGTIVTGTLSDGELKVGDEVEILPGGSRGRIRGLQTHKRKESIAHPGGRTAVNISGISMEHVVRGEVLTHPGVYQSSRRMDVHFRLLKDASSPLKHNVELKMFLGAAETIARVRLLGSEELLPGQEGWLQLELADPIVAVRGDRFILRRPSPGETLGGGSIVDPHPKGRHKRFSADTILSLENLSVGTPEEILMEALNASGATTLKDVIARANLDVGSGSNAAILLQTTGQLVVLDPGSPIELNRTNQIESNDLVASQAYVERVSKRMLQEVQNYHETFPLRLGIPREELRSRLKIATGLTPRIFSLIYTRLLSAGVIIESGLLIHTPNHQIRFSPTQQQTITELLALFKKAPYAPPSIKECQAMIGDDLYQALVDNGTLVAVSSEVVFFKEDYTHMVSEITGLIRAKGPITAAQVRDHFNTSRKFVLGILEHMDEIGVTVREGDSRRLKAG